MSEIQIFVFKPWWLSGLERQSTSSSNAQGPGFESRQLVLYPELYIIIFRNAMHMRGQEHELISRINQATLFFGGKGHAVDA